MVHEVDVDGGAVDVGDQALGQTGDRVSDQGTVGGGGHGVHPLSASR